MVCAFVVACARLAAALDCTVADDATACVGNDDCLCGANRSTSACAVGVEACVGPGDCFAYCRDLASVCRAGHCARARPTGCIGDCDADVVVTVDELTRGVAIVLGFARLESCASFDSDRDGSVTVDELVIGANGALRSCAQALPPPPSLVGVYDTSLTYQPGGAGEAVAVVSESSGALDLSIHIGPNESIDVTAAEDGDGMLHLTGFYLVTDIGYALSGTATRHDSAEEGRIDGMLRIDSAVSFAPFETASFVMRRASGGTPAALSGGYRVVFSPSPRGTPASSRTTVVLDIARDGRAFMSEGVERAADGTLLGTLTTGDCSVSPQGHLACSARYLIADTELTPLIRVTGRLLVQDDAVTGGGAFLTGVDPPFGDEPYVHGAWNAERMPSP